MNRTTIGALLFAALGLILIVGGWLVWPMLQDRDQVRTSDAVATKGTIVVGADGFLGYGPLCSPYMRSLMLTSNWLFRCENDQADYDARFQKLRDGQIQFAVTSVDGYVRVGARYDFPGVITNVLGESQGADAIVALRSAAPDLASLGQLLDGIRVGYTPESPSEHLAKTVGVDFDVPVLRTTDQQWFVPANGSGDVAAKLRSGEIQVGVLWEPELSTILARPEFVKLLGTEGTKGLIVDALIAGRDFAQDSPEVVELVLTNYFKTLKYYRSNADRFAVDMAAYAGVTKGQIPQMADTIKWANLHDNATQWMGVPVSGAVPRYGLVEAINGAVRTLRQAGDISQNPLPGSDPRRIVNSSAVSSLFSSGLAGTAVVSNDDGSTVIDFRQLSRSGWENLAAVGTLKLEPILFESGSNRLSAADQQQIDDAVEALESYPRFYIEVQGHTQPSGDRTANQRLSQRRADAVVEFLASKYQIDPDRVRAVGLGGSSPLPRQPGESYRAYSDRLARVEIHLKQEVF